MNELQIFNNPEFGEIRCSEINGELWFVAADVCRALEIGNPSQAMARLDDDEKDTLISNEGGREMNIVNEPGLYSLVLGSRKSNAKTFKRWITHDVVPAIRRTGSYSIKPQPAPDPYKTMNAEAKLNNSRAKLAAIWMQLAQANPIPEYRQICAHYASAELTGGTAVLPLPESTEKTYTAKEVGEMLGGISANMVGRLANKNGLKTREYGIEVWDKSAHSSKQVQSWRYNNKAVDKLRELCKTE